MNIKAMQATRHEYITNFAAVKGTDYAQFISGAAVILTGCDVVLAGVRRDRYFAGCSEDSGGIATWLA